METDAHDSSRHADTELDVTGLQCPMPLLKAKLSLNGMAAGQVLKVVATDFQAFVEQSRHAIVAFEKDDTQFRYWIRKG